jgi:hypothetical protein
MSLQRLVLDYRNGELVVRALYRSQDGPNPGTKARAREVSRLARSGLQDALKALEGGAGCVGTSGFTTREDILLATASPAVDKLVKGGDTKWHNV